MVKKVNKKEVIKKEVIKRELKENPHKKLRLENNPKLFLVAFISSIVFLVSVIGFLFLNSIFFILMFFSNLICLISVYFLSKKYNNKFLKIFIIVNFCLIIIYFISVTYIFNSIDYNSFFSELNSFNEKIENGQFDLENPEDYSEFIFLIKPFLILALLSLGFIFISYILLGIGFLKFKKELKYSKLIGIFYIVGAFSIIIFIGFFILFVAEIFRAIMFFKEYKL